MNLLEGLNLFRRDYFCCNRLFPLKEIFLLSADVRPPNYVKYNAFIQSSVPPYSSFTTFLTKKLASGVHL